MFRINSRKFVRRKGLPPGTLITSADHEEFRIRHIRFSPSQFQIQEYVEVDKLSLPGNDGTVNWFQVFGPGNVEKLAELGELFGIHKLTLEDIQNTDRRPGFENHEDYLFQSLKRLVAREDQEQPRIETVSLITLNSAVISFHENGSGGYQDIIRRIESSKGRVRRSGAGYLTYVLVDEAMDTWLSYTEGIEERLIKLEDEVIFHYDDKLIESIHSWKKQIAWLRWLFRPYRDIRTWVFRDGESWFGTEATPYLTDITDHAIRISDVLDLYREMVDGLLSVHMTTLSNRMNGIMKVLTIISTIFIPMTFIAGIYGMNFMWIPEIGWKWGYPSALAVMAASAIGILVFLKRKKWL